MLVNIVETRVTLRALPYQRNENLKNGEGEVHIGENVDKLSSVATKFYKCCSLRLQL